MILLNYQAFLVAVAFVMACVVRSSITEKVIFESKSRFEIIFQMKKNGLEIYFQANNFFKVIK